MKHREALGRTIAEIRNDVKENIRQKNERQNSDTIQLLEEAFKAMSQESSPIVNITMPDMDTQSVNVVLPPLPAPQIRFVFGDLDRVVALLESLTSALRVVQAPVINVTATPPDVQVNVPQNPVKVVFEGKLGMPEIVEDTESFIRRGTDQKMIGLLTRTTRQLKQ